MAFTTARDMELKLRLLLTGPAGGGKTYTALEVGTALLELTAPGKRVALIDTEAGSAGKYKRRFDFDVDIIRPPFTPEKYLASMTEAANSNRYGLVIVDSLSHAWAGPGGILEFVDTYSATNTKGNTWAAWAKGTPLYNRLVQAVQQSPLHVIATARSKMDTVQEKQDGKTTVRAVGMNPVMRDGIQYEFDIVADLSGPDNVATFSKSRCPDLNGAVIQRPGADVARTLADWLKGDPDPRLSPAQLLAEIEEMGRELYGEEWEGEEGRAAKAAAWASGKMVNEIASLLPVELERVHARLISQTGGAPLRPPAAAESAPPAKSKGGEQSANGKVATVQAAATATRAQRPHKSALPEPEDGAPWEE